MAIQNLDFGTAADGDGEYPYTAWQKVQANFAHISSVLTSAITSWAGVTRASGYDNFAVTPSSANLRTLLADKTGAGVAVFSDAPTLVNPVVGTQTARDNTTKAASTAYVDGATRERLSTNLTLYVRKDGNDSNNGLANTSGGAFLTIQKAVDVVLGRLDLGGFAVTIQVADGTYTGAVNLTSAQVGAGTITIQGNNSTPANVVISTTSASCFAGNAQGVKCTIKDLKMQTTTSGYCIEANSGSVITFQNVDFGACANSHVAAAFYGLVSASGAYSITGNAICHFDSNCGAILCGGRTITLTGTPAFSVAFARSQDLAKLQIWSNVFSGSATGSRYIATGNGLIQTFGGSTTAFPGNSAGSTATGGQFL